MNTELVTKNQESHFASASVLISTPMRRFFIATILGAISGMAPLCTDLYLPALPHVAEFLHTNTALTQLSLTTSLLGIAFGQAFIGPLSDMHGRRSVLLISLLIFTLSSFFCATAGSIEMLIFLRLIQGISGAGAVVLSRAVACDLYSGTELTRFFALLMLINGFAPIISPVLGGQILKFTDWRGIFVILGFIGVFFVLLTIFGLKETLPTNRRSAAGVKAALSLFKKLFSNKPFMRYASIHAVAHITLFGYIAAAPFIFQDIYGLNAEEFSFCFAAGALCIVGASQLGGKLSVKYGEERLLKISLYISALVSVVLLGITFAKTVPLYCLFIPILVLIACFGLTAVTSFTLAIRQQVGMAGSASGLIGVYAFLLGGLASPLVGLGGSHTTIPFGIVMAFASILPLFLNRTRSKS